MTGSLAWVLAALSTGSGRTEIATQLQATPTLRVPVLVVGVGLLVAAVVDLLWTTLWVDGGSGPLSSRLTSWTWRGFRRLGGERSRVLGLAGPVILTATLVMWVGLLWAGWSLVFAGGEAAILPARDDVPVTWTGRIYFVGYTMFTMGNGDFYPPAGVWQLAASLTTASGMLFVTMGVTYVLSVLGAVADKRSFASGVTGMGENSEAVVRAAWHEGEFDGIQLPLDSLATQLDSLADQHRAYPILHYYHSQEPDQAPAMAVAIFDEAMTLFRFGVQAGDRPDPILVRNARAASRGYLDALQDAYVNSTDDVPPPPDLGRLRAEGIPTVPDEEFADALDDLEERRRELLSVVNADAWHWPPIDR